MYIMLVFYRHMNEIKVYIYILLVNRHCVQKYIFILIKLKKKLFYSIYLSLHKYNTNLCFIHLLKYSLC